MNSGTFFKGIAHTHTYTQRVEGELYQTKPGPFFIFRMGAQRNIMNQNCHIWPVSLWFSRSCNVHLSKTDSPVLFWQCGHEFCLSDAFSPIIKIDALCETNKYPILFYFTFLLSYHSCVHGFF